MPWPETIHSVELLPALGCAAGAYVLGCFATGYYLVRARTGRDIRSSGSGSIGARNVGRELGRGGFLLTLLGDFFKGALAVLAARHFFDNPLFAVIAMLSVVVGHIWPLSLGGRGGKGVATSLGALLMFDWQLAILYAAIFVVAWSMLRRTTLGGLAAYLFLPAIAYGWHHVNLEATALALLAELICWAHRQNLLTEIPALAARRQLTAKPHSPKS